MKLIIIISLILLLFCGSAAAWNFNGMSGDYGYNTTSQVMTDHNGLRYAVQDNGVVIVNDERYMAFAIRGDIGANTYTYTSMDYSWTWHIENNSGDYTFWADNNNPSFIWKQYFYFYANGTPMKVKHYLENNISDITNAQMFYLTNVTDNDLIGRSGISYRVGDVKPLHFTGDFNAEVPKITFNGMYNFNFNDLIDDGFTINEFYIGNGSIVGYPTVDIMAVGFTKDDGNFLFGSHIWIDPSWESDSGIVLGLGDVGDRSTPTVFQKDGIWYLVSGNSLGQFTGFNWTGSTWQSDTQIVSGLSDAGSYSIPLVFQKDGVWYLISGRLAGDFVGYNWTGSTWQSDTQIVSGFEDTGGSSSSLSIFQKDSIWYSITGEYLGIFYGYNWTGTTWQSDTQIVSGLGDIGTRSKPSVFQKDGVWYLISGNTTGHFIGFNWTGSTWQSDTQIVSGLMGDQSAPTVFQKDGVWYLISGREAGAFLGFKLTIPPYVNISLHSSDPCCIYTNYTGSITGNYIVESNHPLNYTSLAFLFGLNYTPTADMHSYLKVPANDIAAEGIYRAHNRNTTPYMTWKGNTTITEDNVWQWSGGDNDSFWITKSQINSTHTWINMTGIASNVFPSMFYINRDAMYAAPKTGFEINRHQGIIIKMFDLEGYRNRNNDYYVSMYPDTQLESTTPTENIDIWYCNDSLDPLVDDPTTCACCVRMDTWASSRWMDHETWQPHDNVSYAKPLTAYAGTHPEIPPDEVVYLYFASDTVTSKSYIMNATNHDPGICNITYAQTNTMWTYDELSDTSTPVDYTPSFYTTFVRDYEEFLHHLYIANNQDVWGHSDIYNISIGISDVSPTYCKFNYYWWNDTTDYYMNGTYTENFWVNLTYGFDPDNGAALTHVLSLYDEDYNFVAFINDSLVGNATDTDIYADIVGYNHGDRYMFKIVSTDNEGSTSVTWSKTFILPRKNTLQDTINIIEGFPTVINNILSTFVSFLPLLVGILVSGFILIITVGIFSKFKRW